MQKFVHGMDILFTNALKSKRPAAFHVIFIPL